MFDMRFIFTDQTLHVLSCETNIPKNMTVPIFLNVRSYIKDNADGSSTSDKDYRIQKSKPYSQIGTGCRAIGGGRS
jgi:hypothetical protein